MENPVASGADRLLLLAAAARADEKHPGTRMGDALRLLARWDKLTSRGAANWAREGERYGPNDEWLAKRAQWLLNQRSWMFPGEE